MKQETIRTAAKAGYASRGVIYVILGGLAVAGAFGSGGGVTSTKGALLKLFETGFGTLLLAVMSIGLFGYAAWRFMQSVLDADNHGTGLKGMVVRCGLLVSAITHTILGVWAINTVMSGPTGRDGGGSDAVRWLMEQPFGPWLVGIAAFCVIGAGLAHIKKGFTAGFEKWFDAPESRMKTIRPLSMAGLVVRGIVFVIVGGMGLYAAYIVEPGQAGGIKEALIWLQDQPFGPYLFAMAAIGLVLFGFYSLAEARYRTVSA